MALNCCNLTSDFSDVLHFSWTSVAITASDWCPVHYDNGTIEVRLVLNEPLPDLPCSISANFFTASQSRAVHVLHNSEQPASCFSILDSGTSIVADLQFDILMQKMKSYFPCRKNIRVEVRGQRYQLGDFVVKIGSVIVGQMTNFKGVLVEVS